MDIQYSVGEKRDCVEIANWINKVGHGHIEYLYDGLVKGRSALAHLTTILSEDPYYSYKNVDLALQNNVVIGLVFSYPAELNQITTEMRQILSTDRIKWIANFADNLIDDSWYVSTLGVLEPLRRKGIANTLMRSATARALNNGYKALSLHVYENNIDAIKFYEAFGFSIVKKVELNGHSFFQSKGLPANFLMKYEINEGLFS